MMIWRYIRLSGSILLFAICIAGCQSDYTKLVKSELAKGVRYDSILLGTKLGSTRNDFYGLCYDLNKQGIITAGASGSVQYVFKDSLVHKLPTFITLLFVPAFDDKDVLTNLDIKFSYSGWASGNRALQSDSLQVKLKELIMRWYGGNSFVTATVDGKEIPVKLDGNRRIVVTIKDQQNVLVKVQDILHPKFQHSISKEEKKDQE